MPKGSLYAAHRAAGAASGRYKASLYDIANVGYAMEADVGIEQHKQKRTQETFASIGEALGLAETIRGTYQARKDYKEMASKYGLEDTKKTETPKSETPVQPKVPTLEEKPIAAIDTVDKPTMAKEVGLDVTSEELEEWKTSSGWYDPEAGKSSLTQWANWAKAGKKKADISTRGDARPGVMNW